MSHVHLSAQGISKGHSVNPLVVPHPEVGEVSSHPLIPNDSLSTLSYPCWSITPPTSLIYPPASWLSLSTVF